MKKKKRMKACYDRKSKARSINIGDPVFAKTHERTGPKYTPAVMHDRDGVVTVSEANDGRMITRHMDHVRNRYPIVEDRVERPDMREVDESGPMNDADTSVVRMPTHVPVLVTPARVTAPASVVVTPTGITAPTTVVTTPGGVRRSTRTNGSLEYLDKQSNATHDLNAILFPPSPDNTVRCIAV